MKRQKGKEEGPPLPLSSLRLLVPPLHLVSAALWHVVERRDVMDYGLVEEFVTSVLEIVPDMMTYRERIQLIMGLRAQICDPEVEASGSNFLKLIETLQEDPVEKDHFFQKVFPEEFGPKYHSALQTLMWEFLSRLEKLLPTPTLQQTVSWFLPERCVLEECLQAVSQPQPLRFLLQNHTNKSAASHTKNKASGDQHILSSMSCSSPETQDALTDQADLESEQTQGFMSIQSPASADIELETSPPFDYWENELVKDCVEVLLNKEKEPGFGNVECVNKEITEININDGVLDKESSTEMNVYKAFLNHHTDSGVNIHGRAFRHHEVHDISTLLLQPRVLLQRLDISDMLLPESEVSSTRRRDGERSQGKDEGEVISQSQSSVSPEPSDRQPLCSLVPDTSSNDGQPLRSKRVKTCSFCGKTFREAKDLTAHVRSHTELTPSHCILIGQDVEQHENFQKHQQKVCELPVQSEEDYMSATSVEDMTEMAHNTLPRRRHMKRKRNKPGQTCNGRKCPLCDKPFGKVSSLNRHMKYKHRKLLCVNCGEYFENSEFKKHKEECLLKCVSCPLCGDKFELSETNQLEVINQQPSKADTEDDMLYATTEHVAEIHLPSNITPQTITPSHSRPFQKVNNYRTCLLCQESFVNREAMTMHLKFQHGVLPYPCFKCDESFQSTSDLKKHSNECSGRNISDSIKCPRCRLKTSNYTHQRQEVTLKKLQPDRPLHAEDIRLEISQSSCTEVDFSNDSQPHQSNHFVGQSNPADVVTWSGPQIANMCDEMNVQSSQDLTEEVNADQPLQEFDPADRNSSHALRSHETENPLPQISEPESPVDSFPTLPAGVDLDCRTCHVCSKSFRRRKYLTLHLRRHGEGQGAVQCSICSKMFPRNRELMNHLAKKTGCGSMRHNLTTVFSQTNDTSAHLTCRLCLQQFTTKNKLKCHMVRHTGKGLSCRFCGKMFAESGSLDRHINSHIHRPYLCDQCGKDFTTETDLRTHKYVHTGERPFCCTDCGKSFKAKGNLKYHQMTHTGERPFACTLCQVRCRNNKQLKLHMMQVHTLERPFQCHGCSKGFVQKSSLNYHLSLSPTCLMAQTREGN